MQHALLLAVLTALPPLSVQQGAKDKRKPGQIDPPTQIKVDEAIKRGVDYLLKIKASKMDELVLWTLLQSAIVPRTDPVIQDLVQAMVDAPLERTYRVSLQAMIFEELDRIGYQWRIRQCAQFLADNQCVNGAWNYGEPSPFADAVPTGDKAKKESPKAANGKTESKAVTKVTVIKKRDGPKGGDNSNSQYAALGLRACHNAGIVFEKKLIELARTHWRNDQDADGAWFYGSNRDLTGSMTAGGVGAMVIYDHILGESWKKDKAALNGLDWLGKNFSVKENPGCPRKSAIDNEAQDGHLTYFYYMYALERAGILFGTEVLGTREWYPEGVNVLLGAQKPDGSWRAGTIDTCFAILFLRRATRPLTAVASVDRFKKP